MTCEYEEDAMALPGKNIRFGWQLISSINETMQTAYQIEVQNEQQQLIWNEGKVMSAHSQLISYQGEPLLSGQKYAWRLKVWDNHQNETKWSQWHYFRMAPDSSWMDAQWIGAITRSHSKLPKGRNFEGSSVGSNSQKKAMWSGTDTLSRKSLYLRKDFQLDKKLKEAIVYISGLGHYELSINGKKIGDSEFAPLWSDYDKTVYYNTYDVTSFLQKKNAVGVLLGNGFFNVQGGRYKKLLNSFGPPTLFFKMHLVYEDGSFEDLMSDASWKYDFSPITFNCIYGGEDYNANLEQAGWDKFGFNDASWQPVVLQEAPLGKLTPQTAPPVKIIDRYEVKEMTYVKLPFEKKKNQPIPENIPEEYVYVLDMGQNLAGFPEFTVQGKKGDKVKLVVGESLGKGVVNQSQSGKPHYYEYTLKGAKSETWHPRFSYYGFRYIQVQGAVMEGEPNPNQLPVIKKIQSCFIYNSAEIQGSFESSNTIFNNTHRLINMAVRSNMQAIFTDCPHREKLGWLEQVQLCGEGIMYNYDMSRLFPKVMQDMADEQYENGLVPTTAPMYVEFGRLWNDSPEWGSTSVILPFMYYERYGDDALIRQYYPVMRAYVDYLEASSDNHIVMQGLGDWYDFGEKRCGFAQNTPVPLVGTAHQYQNIQYIIRAAKMLGKEEDVEKYTRLGEEVNKAFHQTYFRADSCIYGTGSQSSYALPLFMNMVPESCRQQAMDHLVADIKAHGVRLTTGEVGNRYMFQVLARNGLNELMYEMHNHEEVPGYGFQLKFGATTLTEQWDPRQGASWNHFMLGSIDEWFFRSLGGIQMDPLQPGGQHLIIHPEPVGDLNWVKCSAATLYGKVSVDWKIQDNVFDMIVNIPVNSSASVYLPGGDSPVEILSGEYHFSREIIK